VRVAVTGITSDFGTVIAPLLFADPDIEEVVGIDLRDPRVADSKLRFEREDVRSERMAELFAGCDAVVHLAYVVAEIHDKELTHSINIGGSQNVLEASVAAGAKRLVVASSVASYGAHPDHPEPVTEEEFPRGNPDKYYFYDKAEVEHYIEWWLGRNRDTPLQVVRLRPAIIVGPHFSNSLVDRLPASTAVLPAQRNPKLQLVWEDDLARAFYKAVKGDAQGAFNIATDDAMPSDQFAGLHGQRIRRVPRALAAPLADVLFRLRLSPASSAWVTDGELVVSPDRAKRELGWSPRFSTSEVARMMLVQHGRPMLAGQSRGLFARKRVAEATLAPATDALRDWARRIPGLRDGLEGPADIDRIVDRVEHDVIGYRDLGVHLEVHPAKAGAGAPTVVFSPGIGGHARFYTPFTGRLCDEGFNVVAIDRPGHGLSEGRRGDCTMEQILDVVEATVAYARGRFGGPVALAGSSLGGIINWYALTREPDVEAVVCHNVAHPQIAHEPAARLKIPPLKRLARAAPLAPVPIKQIADFGAVAEGPELLDWFRRERDPIWSWRISARSAGSIFTFEPRVDWSQVDTPVLVMVGETDEMVSAAFTERVLAESRPPRCELRVMPGMGHMLLLENLDRALPVIAGWLQAALAAPVPREAVEA
jgi:nucleoside-diphosphate-sugar epimerase/pimeloyl-ACP methyl ester carboxylesterase